MPRKLLVATTNTGKLKEVSAYLAVFDALRFLSLKDLPPMPEVEEDGDTFEANAIKKATEYSKFFDGLTLADDSGLCVDFLDDAPGVQSARYGGPGLDDAGRNRHLLEAIKDVGESHRSARFVCALALASKGRLLETFDGKVEGRILQECRGENGFGYDPLFYYEPFGLGFGEITREKKATVSHRGKALAALADYFQTHPEIL
jgi:XTP/dITP diphosphohydrolase